MDVLEQGTNLYERCREGMRSPNLLRRMTVPGTRGALAAVVAAGLVALLLVAGNVPGGPVPAASASSSDGSLSGTVTEAGNAGTIAPAVCVYAAAQGGPPSYNTTTAANGSYQFADIAAGQYSVWFDPTCKGAQTSPYATQYYDDVPDISAATWVTVPGGGSVGGIDADLALAGTISGLVSGPSGPLQGVCVIAYDSVDGDEVGATTTASNGGYSVQLPPGGYLVQFDPTCRAVNTYASQFYDDVPDAYAASKSNTNVVEVTGGATQTANATLQPGGTVEGTVVAPGATSSAGTCVIAYDPGGDQIGAVLTNASGNYELTDLPAQTYRIVFDPTCNDGQPSDFQLEAYGSLPVAAGQTVAGINGTLALVACLVAPYVTTTSLPAGSVSAPYSATLQASGGTGPYTWTAVGLPTSLSLDTATGAISKGPFGPLRRDRHGHGDRLVAAACLQPSPTAGAVGHGAKLDDELYHDDHVLHVYVLHHHDDVDDHDLDHHDLTDHDLNDHVFDHDDFDHRPRRHLPR